MSWFSEQMETRHAAQDALFQHALESLCAAVTGDDSQRLASAMGQAHTAISKILAYYGAKPANEKISETNIYRLLDKSLVSTDVMYREVSLPPGWHKNAIGCFLGLCKDGTPVALIPSAKGGYVYYDPRTGKETTVTKSVSRTILSETAFCFYKPLPNRELSISDLLVFMMAALDKKDYAYSFATAVCATLLGILLPILTRFIYGPVLAVGDIGLVLPVGGMLLSITVAQLLMNTMRSCMAQRVDRKMRLNVQAAVMMRILSLPPSFFKKYSSGELSSRLNSVGTVALSVEKAVFGALMTSLFSLVYVLQLFTFSPLMVVPTLLVIASSCASSFIIAEITARRTSEKLSTENKCRALQFSTIEAMQKIKLAGAEKSTFARWAESFSKSCDLEFGHPGINAIGGPVTTAINVMGVILIYLFAVNGGVTSAADYMAFASIYGMVSAAFSSLNDSVVKIFSIRPHLKQIEPILKEVPESGDSKTRVESIRGGISLQNITFCYEGAPRPLFEGLNLEVKPGEHLALVGKTGCGKSTIMRLMLGFEKPSVGSVFYDNRDLASLDTETLRSHIGVVLQSSALFQGTIFHNIAVASPGLTMERAWELAEMAGVAEDIRRMPMKMMTKVSEGGGGISGGQRQRIIIARALAGDPSILMFDEATSALDNITQSQVSESLKELKCTRIVIAHRLSTIRACDRIVVIDQGKIIEEGTYEELLAQGGLFTQLAERQQI